MKPAAMPATTTTPAATAAAVAAAIADSAAAAPQKPAATRLGDMSAEAEVEGVTTPPATDAGGASNGDLDGAVAARDVAEPPPDAGVVPPQPDARPQTPRTRLDPMYYSSPGAQPFKVRGKNYLTDR